MFSVHSHYYCVIIEIDRNLIAPTIFNKFKNQIKPPKTMLEKVALFGFWQLLNLVNLANKNPSFVCINALSGRSTFAPLYCLAGNFVWLSLFVFLDLRVCVCVTSSCPRCYPTITFCAQFINVLQPFFGHIRQGHRRWWRFSMGDVDGAVIQLVCQSFCRAGESEWHMFGLLTVAWQPQAQLLRLPFSSS